MSLPELPEIERTRAAAWRVQSRTAYAVDSLVLLLGCCLLVAALVDSVASWPNDTVLLSASDLERLAGFILIPSWIWLLASGAILFGFYRRSGRSYRRRVKFRKIWKRPLVIALALLALFVLFVIVVGFVIGADKGSLRILPSGVHQVSAVSLNDSGWVTVSPHEYQVWDARFVREDAFFAYFALFMIACSLFFQRFHSRDGMAIGVPTL